MKLKVVMALAFVVLGLCSIYNIYDSSVGKQERLAQALDKATELEGRELYLSAVDRLNEALSYGADPETTTKRMADDYRAMGNMSAYKSALLDVIAINYANADAVNEYFAVASENSTAAAIEFIKPLYQAHPENETISELYDSVKGEVSENYQEFEYLSEIHNGYMVYQADGKQGLLTESGDISLEAAFDSILMPLYSSDYVPVTVDGKEYYVSRQGYKLAEPLEPLTSLGLFDQIGASACKDGKYGYIDINMNAVTAFEWDAATVIDGGIGAVCKDGKWALIGKNQKLITDYIYDDVVTDDIGICSRNGVVIVSQDGKYRLVNSKGEQVGEATFDNAKAFMSSGPAAVCSGGKWGYVDATGNLVIDCMYEDANSFGTDYAAVCNDGLWGFIDSKNQLIVDYVYDDARTVSKNGKVPVSHDGYWTIMTFKVFSY